MLEFRRRRKRRWSLFVFWLGPKYRFIRWSTTFEWHMNVVRTRRTLPATNRWLRTYSSIISNKKHAKQIHRNKYFVKSHIFRLIVSWGWKKKQNKRKSAHTKIELIDIEWWNRSGNPQSGAHQSRQMSPNGCQNMHVHVKIAFGNSGFLSITHPIYCVTLFHGHTRFLACLCLCIIFKWLRIDQILFENCSLRIVLHGWIRVCVAVSGLEGNTFFLHESCEVYMWNVSMCNIWYHHR